MNPMIYIMAFLLMVLILYVFFTVSKRKVAVDDNGNVSIHGNVLNDFVPNTYFRARTSHNFQFTKDNIEEMKIIEPNDAGNPPLMQAIYMVRKGRILHIKFKKPLKYR